MKKLFSSLLLTALLAMPAAAAVPEDVQAALKEVAQYDHSQPRAPLFTLEQFVARSTGKPEGSEIAAALASVLTDSGSSFVAKVIMCQQLARVGTDAQVPALAKLLIDAQLSDPARLALEGMETAAADTALREALARVTGKQLVGIINSLGKRRDALAVAQMQALVANSDRAVAAAALFALANIGTREAATTITKCDDLTAKLRCAQRLVQNGDAATSIELCRSLVSAGNPANQRVAALAILAKVDSPEARSIVVNAMADADAFVAANAMRQSVHLAGNSVSAALVEQLKKGDAQRQILALNAIAERRDAGARADVEAMTSNANEDVAIAAIAALGAVGNAGSARLLADTAANQKGNARAAAEESLANLAGADVDEAIKSGIANGPPQLRVAMIGAAASRNLTPAIPALLAATRDGETSVRTAAAHALGKIGRAEEYGLIVGALLDSGDPQTRDAMSATVAAVGKRVNDPQAKIAPLMAALKRDNIAGEAAAILLRTLAGIGGADALVAVNERISSPDKTICDAAVRALADWPDVAALPSLLKLSENSANPRHKTFALRGVLRLAPADPQPMKIFAHVQSLAKSKDDKQQLLSALSHLKSPDAMAMAVGLLSDGDVATEAAVAATRVASSLVKSHPEAVDAAMTKVLAVSKDSAEAKNLQAQVRKQFNANSETSRARREEVAKSLPAGCKLVSYLDCGVESVDKTADGVRMWVSHGKDYDWAGDGNAAAMTIAFGTGQVAIDVTGLDAKKNYGVGFTWWDYDDNKREESVWVSGKQIVEKTTLPSWKGKQQQPVTITRAIPADAIRDGKINISFKQEGSGNCVVSEIWLIEGVIGAAQAVTASETKPLFTGRTNPGAAKKALIVTGMEYPGHKWRETAPFLRDFISEDKRIGVEINEDAKAALESPSLGGNDVIVLNYMNWENPGPGDAAQEGLRKAVENGTGLVLVHFACGAFQTWPEFVKIAGRVWNPKFRGHDARGPFNVRIVDAQHEIMKGFKDFGTDDELYTCLDGNTPIHILADANSKVDKKDYPMAFVLQYGKGRVFLCTLGHDVKALGFPDVKHLYRRAAAWAAGLPP